MGSLRNRGTGEECVLSSQHLVGRSPRVNLRIDDAVVSGVHAEIRWDGTTWELRDLDSRNGTFVDGLRLAPSERRTVMAGSIIAFGDPDDLYDLTDDTAPCPSATSGDGTRRESVDGPLLLPDPDRVEYFVFQDGAEWHVEGVDGAGRVVTTGATLHIGDAVWTLDLPMVTESTRTLGTNQLTLGNIALRFTVSRDEEHVDLDLIHGDQVERLPVRSYWYTMLTLARARAKDRDSGVGAAEAGWIHVEDLIAMLGIGNNTLYQHLCRAKRMFFRAKVVDYGNLFERRPNARQIRIGVRQLDVVTL